MAARLTLSALVLIIAAISLSQALRGTGPKKCCFNFNTKPVLEKRVTGYTLTHPRCPKAAVLLMMKTGRELCLNPSAAWVQQLIRRLDSKAAVGQTSCLNNILPCLIFTTTPQRPDMLTIIDMQTTVKGVFAVIIIIIQCFVLD
uniref:Chemokine interleukin-8-like domain-containing protein n=1 Tax=Neogobius melanostomus TaxID=47308 RepID=A0A8C6TJJ0_9GOBI